MNNLRAWIHWVKKNPINEDTLELAYNVAVLYTINDKLKRTLRKTKKKIKDKKLLAEIEKIVSESNYFDRKGVSFD